MGEKTLVEVQISDAMELVRRLDARNAAPTFAAWYFYSEIETWRLLIAGPAFNPLLPGKQAEAYGIVIEAISDLPVSSLSVADVKLMTTHSSLPKTVGLLIRTPADGLIRAHFTDNYINGIFLKEMYVLRSAVGSAVPAV